MLKEVNASAFVVDTREELAGLPENERDMIRRLDWLALIRHGAIFFVLEKLVLWRHFHLEDLEGVTPAARPLNDVPAPPRVRTIPVHAAVAHRAAPAISRAPAGTVRGPR